MIIESQHIEFKSSFNDEVIITLVAFANATGGKVYVGLDDNGDVVSNFSVGKESIPQWLNEIKNKTIPSIIPDVIFEEEEGNEILVFAIQEFPVKPVSFKGRYYKRVKNANHQMNLQEISDLHLKTFNNSWDYYPSPHYGLEAIALEKVSQFILKSNQIRENQIEDDPLTVLRKFEMLKDNGQIANGCYLLFAKNDVFDATISIGRFATETSIKDSVVLRTDLFTEVDATLAFLRKHINKNYIITGDPQREERWEYPLEALREIVVNMIVHRDYQNAGDSIIKIFDHKIEFYNPGGLGNGLTISALQAGTYTSYARNRKIADLFREAGIIEKYGSGIKRITNAFIDYGLTVPVFEDFQNGFRVTVFDGSVLNKDNVTEDVTDKVTDKVTDNQMKILQLIQKNERITTNELAIRLNISQRKIKVNIAKLKEKELLLRVGSSKSGYWKINTNVE